MTLLIKMKNGKIMKVENPDPDLLEMLSKAFISGMKTIHFTEELRIDEIYSFEIVL